MGGSKELIAFFKERGIRQEDIAEQLGVSQAYVSSILTGKAKFGKKQANRFSELYGLSASWLLTGEGEMLAGKSSPEDNDIAVLRERVAQLEKLLEEKERTIQILIKK